MLAYTLGSKYNLGVWDKIVRNSFMSANWFMDVITMESEMFEQEDLEKEVIIVDKDDQELGRMGKIDAHKLGKLHRAFSIFLFNQDGEVLLQQRSTEKYHSGGLWTNTCCGHPEPGEGLMEAAERRLFEEMYINTKLHQQFTTTYRAELDNDLIEHEVVHVFYGAFDEACTPNSKEARDWGWYNLEEIREKSLKNPADYAYWMRYYFEHHWEEVLMMQEKTMVLFNKVT